MNVLDLWLPIVVSAAVVFFASFLAHMVLPYHRKDWGKLPNEDSLLEWVRSNKPAPGQYMFPCCENWNELKDPEKKKRYEAGPHGTVNVWPGMADMKRNLILTFCLYLLIGFCVAYLGSVALSRGAEYMDVFRFIGTAAIMSYCLGFFGNTIWFNQPKRPFFNDLIDGIVYGLLTAGVFGWLWPKPEVMETALALVG